MIVRLCKVALVAAVGFFFFTVLLTDVFLDYRGNYTLVQHVLSMDTLSSGESQAWRALRDPTPQDHSYWVHHLFYWTIIVWEGLTCGLCFWGAANMFRKSRGTAAEFNQAKRVAILGLTVSLLEWWVALFTVAGEWFLMWQSKEWNEQDSAFRMFACLGIVLIFINQKEED